MPTKLSYSTISRRFDFAVPLEDIFGEQDIHPRLQYVMQHAYELYLQSPQDIEELLNEPSLDECLKLKQQITFEKQLGQHLQWYSAGSYFWIIRHFLGQLPIPLLPSVTSTHMYKWKELSIKCSQLLHVDNRTEADYGCLAYKVARNLGYLPDQHKLLIDAFIWFVREICKQRNCKQTTKCLARYYCAAIFIRPFRPGHYEKHETMLPLLIFMITKWHHISKYLRTEYVHSYPINKKYSVNSCTQTNCLSQNNYLIKYLKDVDCQTNTSDIFESNNVLTDDNNNSQPHIDRNIVTSNFLDDNSNNENCSFKSFNTSVKTLKMESFVNSLMDIQEEDIQCERCKQGDIIFSSTFQNDQEHNWSDVIEEIRKTVSKVETYDYENEALHQAENGSDNSCDRNSNCNQQRCVRAFNSLRRTTPRSSENSSVKNINDSVYKTPIGQLHNTSLYYSFCKSDDELYSINGKGASCTNICDNINGNNLNSIQKSHDQNTSSYSSKSLRMKLNILGTIHPRLLKAKESLKKLSSTHIKYKQLKF